MNHNIERDSRFRPIETGEGEGGVSPRGSLKTLAEFRTCMTQPRESPQISSDRIQSALVLTTRERNFLPGDACSPLSVKSGSINYGQIRHEFA